MSPRGNLACKQLSIISKNGIHTILTEMVAKQSLFREICCLQMLIHVSGLTLNCVSVEKDFKAAAQLLSAVISLQVL